MLKEKRDGKRITIRLTKKIESYLEGNTSEIALKAIAYEVAKKMSIYDDQQFNGGKK